MRRGFTLGLIMVATLAGARTWGDEFSVPPLTGPVVDAAGLIDPEHRVAIASYLRELRESGGSQINVVTLADLGDLPIEQASIKIVESWRLGDKERDDGVMLLIAAKQRRIRIEVGRGREGVLPDVIASRIVREVLSPRMRRGEVGAAIEDGVRAIVLRTDPEFAARARLEDEVAGPPRSNPRVKLFQVLLWLVLLIIFLKGNRMFGAGALTGGLMRGPLGGWGGGSDDAWSRGGRSGGWGGGGGSNDDWSGGGGGFSGGGASGEW